MSLRSRFTFAVALGLLSSLAHSAQAGPSVVCHITYGGETRDVMAAPVASPYAVQTIDIGSYFLFRAVVQNAPADIAAIKLYVYSDGDDGPVLIHQVDHRYPPPSRTGDYGFTGLNRVYETMRDGELEYWCGWLPVKGAAK